MRVTASQLRLLVPFLALMLLCSCASRKPATAPLPPQGAPVATPEPTPSPSPTPAPSPGQNPSAQQSQLPAQGTPPPEPSPTPAVAQTEKKAKNTKQHSAKKTVSHSGTRETAEAKNPKALPVPEPEITPASGQISPGGNASVARGEPTTEQLLQKTENNLNNLKRQLSPDEQTVVTQIRDFMNQSRQATKENDASRAHNFALKASLLCDDLINRH